MPRSKIAVASIFASAVLCSGYAQAWGPEGHAIVAEIAETRLTDGAKAQIAQLLALDDSHAKHLDQIASRPTRLAVSGGEANSDVEWQDQSGQDKYTAEVVLHSIGSLLCSTGKGPEKVSSRANAISMSVSYR